MEQAFEIAGLDEVRERSRGRGLDLPMPFPKFCWNGGQSQGTVHGRFVGRGDEFTPAPQRGPVQGEPLRLGVVGQLVEVGPTSGCLEEHGPGIDRRGDDDLRARPAREAQGDDSFVGAGELMNAGKVGQAVEHLRRRDIGHYHDDQLLDQLHAPAHVCHHLCAQHTRELVECGGKVTCLFGRVV